MGVPERGARHEKVGLDSPRSPRRFPARAYDASLKAFQGKAFVRAAGATEYRPLRAGQKFRRDDTIRTGDGGRVQVAFKSGATVLVKENSRFSLRSDKNGDALSFVRGEFLIGLRNRLKGRNKFTVRTPACVAAVRGTVFWGLSDDKKKSTYACFTGAIEITAEKQSVTSTQGQSWKWPSAPRRARPLRPIFPRTTSRPSRWTTVCRESTRFGGRRGGVGPCGHAPRLFIEKRGPGRRRFD